MGKYKIKFKNGALSIANPKGFEFRYHEETGLEIGQSSTDVDLAVKILTANTPEGQRNFKERNDTATTKYAMRILEGTQSQGMLNSLYENEDSVEVLITRIE